MLIVIVSFIGVVLIAVVKLSASGKQLQFITDEGVLFGTSSQWVQMLIAGTRFDKKFIVLNRLPVSVSANRYPKSRLYDASTGELRKLGDNDYRGSGSDGFDSRKEKVKNVVREIEKW